LLGGRLGSQQPVVAHILHGESVPIVAADHRIGQVEVFDHGLQFSLVFLGHLAAEDGGDLPGLSNIPVQAQQAASDLLHSCPARKDEIIAVLHLGKKQTMLQPAYLRS